MNSKPSGRVFDQSAPSCPECGSPMMRSIAACRPAGPNGVDKKSRYNTNYMCPRAADELLAKIEKKVPMKHQRCRCWTLKALKLFLEDNERCLIS